MKVNILLLLPIAIILLGTGCGSFAGNNPTANEKYFEGWAGPPEDMKKKPFEYFYMKKRGRIPLREKRSSTTIQKNCISDAAQSANADYLRKMVGETLTNASGISDSEFAGKAVAAEFYGKIKDLKTKDCKPLEKPQLEAPGIEWNECECIFFARVPDGKYAIITRAQEIELENRK